MIASIEPDSRKIRRRNGAIDYPFYERRMKRLRRLALQRLYKRIKTALHKPCSLQYSALNCFRL